jgi:hypothetical protein
MPSSAVIHPHAPTNAFGTSPARALPPSPQRAPVSDQVGAVDKAPTRETLAAPEGRGTRSFAPGRRSTPDGTIHGRRSGGSNRLRPAAKAIVAGLGQAGPGLPERADQCRQHLPERGVDFDIGERVATRRAPVDDRHRDPHLPSPVHEPQA